MPLTTNTFYDKVPENAHERSGTSIQASKHTWLVRFKPAEWEQITVQSKCQSGAFGHPPSQTPRNLCPES